MKITRIEPIVATLTPKKKVAAYARVSMESDRLNHSLSAQVSYYSNLIQNNPAWIYVGVYRQRHLRRRHPAQDGIQASGRGL